MTPRLPLRRAAWLLALPMCLAAAAPDDTAQPLDALPYSPGLDLRSMDPQADPCADFYRYACGGWIASHPIPPDESGWSVYQKLQDENTRYLWGLLRQAAEPAPDRVPHAQKAGDYFAACMARGDDGPGADALAEPLKRVAELDSLAALPALLARLHALGVDASLFDFGSEQDAADSSRVIAYVAAGGLGLPDRDHYLLTDRTSVKLRSDYQAHVERSFALAGEPADRARAAASTVLAIETRLARATLARDDARDPRKVYHRMDVARLSALAPAFGWRSYLDASGVAAEVPLNVTQPRFVRALNGLLRSRPLADWRSYLRWHVLRSQSPYLSAAWAQEHFAFYNHTLEGVQALPPRWKRCVQWADRDVGEALGRLFVDRSFAPQTKTGVLQMTHRIEAAMRERIATLDWMAPPTRAAALAKLGTLTHKIGYPERWRDYAGLALSRDDFLGNVQRAQSFERTRQLAKIGRPVDRDEWGMTAPTVNAYYEAALNDMNFPAGILQPPLYDPAMDDAPNYGNTGATIGHELTHGFDDSGRQYDAQGNLRNWWSAQDEAAFKRKSQCVVDQYSQYSVGDGVHVNGRLTLGEDLADLGGTMLAYVAWKATGPPPTPRDGYTPDQRFFIGMAQWACSSQRPEAERLDAITNEHSPPRFRVNGVLSNLPEFAQAFACKPGQPMVRPKPCRVW